MNVSERQRPQLSQLEPFRTGVNGSNGAEKSHEDRFIAEFIQQLEIQAGKSQDENAKPHPDAGIQQFLGGLHMMLQQGDSDLRRMISILPQTRKHIDAAHLTDLIARAVQFRIHQGNDSDLQAHYANFSELQWVRFFHQISANPEELARLQTQLETRQVATHVLDRYRAFAALTNTIGRGKALSVADIGCSLNWGLHAVAKNLLPSDEPLNDHTRNQDVLKKLQGERKKLSCALGIDVQEPDFDWVVACSYFSKYPQTEAKLRKYQRELRVDQQNGTPIYTMIEDVTAESALVRIKQFQPQGLDAIHASMVLYQFSEPMYRQALQNVRELLNPNGVFLELTFEDKDNWFVPFGALSLIRFKEEDGELSQPLKWLRWNSSRCQEVKEGEDFEEVVARIEKIGAENGTNIR